MRLLHCLALCLALCLPGIAQAQSLLGDGPVVADGVTAHRLYVLLPGLASTDRIRIKAKGGTVLSQSVPVPGMLAVDLSVAPVVEAGTLEMRIRAKGGVEIDQVVAVQVVPSSEGGLEVTFEPKDLVSGLQRVTVTVQGAQRSAVPPGARSFALSATMGEIQELQSIGDGAWKAFYIPPVDLEASEAALFTATDLTAPDRLVGAGVLKIGESQSEAAEGEEVAPWMGSSAQLAFAPLPEGTRVPAGHGLRLLVAHTDAGGLPVEAATLAVEGPGAPVAEVVGGGWYAIDMTAPGESGPFSVTATVGELSHTLALEAVGVIPQLSVRSDPSALAEDTRDLVLTTWAKDASGRTLPGRTLHLGLEGATLRGATKDMGNGSYTSKVRLDRGATTVEIAASAELDVGTLPPAGIRIWSEADAVQLGVSSKMPVGVVVVDAFGLPLTGQTVNLAVPLGGGALPPTVATGDGGVGHTEFVPGLDAGPALLRASLDNGLVRQLALWQIPVGQNAPLLPAPGTESSRAVQGEWRGGFPTLGLVQAAAAVVAPVVAAAPAAPALAPQSTPELPSALEAPTETPAPEETTVAADAWGTLGTGVAEAPVQKAMSSSGSRGVGDTIRYPLRAKFLIQDSGYQLIQTTEEDSSTVPPNAEITLPIGLLGIGIQAEYWLMDGALAVEFRERWGRFTVDPGGTGASKGQTLSSLFLGARYRMDTGGAFKTEAGASLLKTNVAAFRYIKSRTDAELVNYDVVGARLAGGAAKSLGPVELRVELAETFAPKPVNTFLGLSGEALLSGISIERMPLMVHGSYGFDMRHMSVVLDGVSTNVLDLSHVFQVGAGIAL